MSPSLQTSYKVNFIGLCAVIAVYFNQMIFCSSCLRCRFCQHLGRRLGGNNLQLMEFHHHVKLQAENFKNTLERSEVRQGAIPK